MNQLELIDPQQYRIVSVKHTGREDEFITFWARNHCGYTPVIGDHCGLYNVDEAARLNDGLDCLAVRKEVVESILSAEPYYKRSTEELHRFYDQRGPVIINDAAHWRVLIKDAQPFRRPKPEYFRGKRRAIYYATSNEQ